MSRSRLTTAQNLAASGSVGGPGSGPTPGARDAAEWLAARTSGSAGTTTGAGLQRWHVEIALDVAHGRAPSEFDEDTATRFHLDIYSEEWGLFFCHAGHASWIRVTDIPFVHGRDDFSLLALVPPLADIGKLIRRIEATHALAFQRAGAAVRTNVPSLEPAVRSWLATL
jgi:hypothetical protein